MATEKIYELWSKRNPQWETRFEDSIIKQFCEYGKGATSMRDDRGKIFGAGYEIFIIAFFIGLYYNQKRPLINDNQKCKIFGQPIQFWGNIDSVKGRKAYPKLREYIFVALIAKTDIDFIALEKDEITVRKAIDMLIQTMEEFANWGFNFIADKMIDNPNYFYSETAFLETFLSFETNLKEEEDPESLN